MASRFFSRIAKHFANETAVVTPNGELLAGSPEKGLEAWKALPREERSRLADLGEYDAALDPRPPEGGLRLKVFSRAFEREGGGDLKIYKTKVARSFEPGRDHFWLTGPETKSLVPADPEKGRSVAVDDRIALRLARTCLIDLVRVGGNGGPRRPEQVLARGLRLRVEEVSAVSVRLAIEGSARMAAAESYRIAGEALYDLRLGAFSRFDAVAFSETGHHDEINGKTLPFAVAFELTREEVPPSSFSAAYFDATTAEERIAAALRRPAPAPDAPAFPFGEADARRLQEAHAVSLGVPVEFTSRAGVALVLVPPGGFDMGSPAGEPGRGGGEGLHRVTLTRAFYLGKDEATVGQFRRFVEATRHVTDVEKSGGGNAHDERAVWEHRPGTSWRRPGYAGPFEPRDDHPVVHVSHSDARAFLEWQQREAPVAGLRWALPTEAQWEWACRAGSASRFWWGADEDATGRVVNAGDRALKRVHPEWPRAAMPMDDGHAFPAPVGSYRANAFGLHDMLGNVWEFCSTRHGAYPGGHATDPGDLGVQESYSVRGGGWSNVPADLRCGVRNSDPPHFGHSNLGFRVALVFEAPR